MKPNNATMANNRESILDYRAPEVWESLDSFLKDVEIYPNRTRRGRARYGDVWDWIVYLDQHDLWLALEGSGKFTIGKVTYPIRRGTLFWLRPGDTGYAVQTPGDPLTVVFARFDVHRKGTSEKVPLAECLLPSRYIPLHNVSRLDLLLTRVSRLKYVSTPFGDTEASLVMHQAVIEAFRQDALNQGASLRNVDPRVARVITHIRTQPAERLSLSSAAQLAGLSPEYFANLFKAQTGITFRQYLPEVRLEHAQQLLEESTMTVTEIAQALGYSDVYHFSKQFKERHGVAPTHFRKGAPQA